MAKLRRRACPWCGEMVTVGKTTGQPFPAHRNSKRCREAQEKKLAEQWWDDRHSLLRDED